MKCMYYLAPSLVSSHGISEDLERLGIPVWLVHIISKDEAGLKREQLQSSNWLETTDLLRNGFIGANLGFIVGVLMAGIVMLLEPFGESTPGIVYFFVVVVATLFGAWVGGLIGMDSMNRKIRRFSEAINDGKYLFLIYAPKGDGEKVKKMMKELHPNTVHVGTDSQFVNPFSRLRRRASAN